MTGILCMLFGAAPFFKDEKGSTAWQAAAEK
jgi:hypothetical protein